MVDDKLAELKQKRDELKQRLADIEADYRQGLDADSEERAAQLENAEVLNEIARTTQQELNLIEEQIQKLTGPNS